MTALDWTFLIGLGALALTWPLNIWLRSRRDKRGSK